MHKIVYVDAIGNRDSYAAGDPTPGRGANEFASEAAALEAIVELGEPDDGGRWEVEQQ